MKGVVIDDLVEASNSQAPLTEGKPFAPKYDGGCLLSGLQITVIRISGDPIILLNLLHASQSSPRWRNGPPSYTLPFIVRGLFQSSTESSLYTEGSCPSEASRKNEEKRLSS
jgi:hypothetical protein